MNTITASASFEPKRGYFYSEDYDEPPMTERQRDFLLQLILDIDNPKIREDYLSQVESGLSRVDASELISSLLPMK